MKNLKKVIIGGLVLVTVTLNTVVVFAKDTKSVDTTNTKRITVRMSSDEIDPPIVH